MAASKVNNGDSWHLDKRVNVSLIAAIILQAMIFGSLYGSLSNEVGHLKEAFDKMGDFIPRIVRMETNIEYMTNDIGEMNQGIKDLTRELKERDKRKKGDGR